MFLTLYQNEYTGSSRSCPARPTQSAPVPIMGKRSGFMDSALEVDESELSVVVFSVDSNERCHHKFTDSDFYADGLETR